MAINVYPQINNLQNSSGEAIGQAGKDTVQTEDRVQGPLTEEVLEELKLVNAHLAEMLGSNLGE